MSSTTQLGTSNSKEIHFHSPLIITVTDSARHIPEQLSLATDDSTSKLFKLSLLLFTAYGMHFHAEPLRQHATDFMRLVNIKTLAPVLYENNLLTLYDMEFLQLQIIIDSDKVFFVYVKLLRCGKEDYEKFMDCLKHPHAMDHIGHEELHRKLSVPQ